MQIDKNKIKKISDIFNNNMWTTIHRKYTHILFSSKQKINNDQDIDYYKSICHNNYKIENFNFSLSYNTFDDKYCTLILKFKTKYFRDIINIFNIDFNQTKIYDKIKSEKYLYSSNLFIDSKINKFIEDLNIFIEFE